MSPDFEYFLWANPTPDQPLFALYDSFDNHFFIQSYNYHNIFELRELIRSKTVLDIVELTNVSALFDNNLIDNSVIESWGLSSIHKDLFRDATPRWKNQHDADIFFKTAVIKDPIIEQSSYKFDSYKLDLQKQIFFIHHCLQITKSDLVKKHLSYSVSLGVDYLDVVDKFFNFSNVDDSEIRQQMLYFLRSNGLFYE